MANNYTQCTVQPFIHKELITTAEIIQLEAAGFSCEVMGDEFYIYSEEGFTEEYEVESEDENGDTTYEEFPIWPIFQRIIERSKSFRPNVEVEYEEIDEIVLEGAFTCDKMRPGEFGGFLTLVTENDVRGASTADLLHMLRKGAIYS